MGIVVSCLAGVSVAGQAFPRFYFMSSADLLDVLSNGNNPARVVHHFPKFFNAIEAQLKQSDMGSQNLQHNIICLKSRVLGILDTEIFNDIHSIS